MSKPAPSPDARALQARAWALQQLHLADAAFAPASADASFRRYYRIGTAPGSRIVMDAPPAQEDCRPFIHVAGLLKAAGVHAPTVVAQDLERGFLLLEDLGPHTFLTVLNEHNADALFADARAALIRWQLASQPGKLPAYDATSLRRELALFPDWYLPRHLDVALSFAELQQLAQAFDLLVARAQAQPQVFVHRDYMPRNLMLSDPNPGVLDFQDAVYGPIAYDVLSLFKDAFLSWPAERVHGWAQQYWDEARAAGLPVPAEFETFWQDFEWIGLQRHLKVLGIFARLTYRDGKPLYVADTPRFVRYVMEVAPKYDALAPLTKLFERHVVPRLAGGLS